jgi:hypothetical protein
MTFPAPPRPRPGWVTLDISNNKWKTGNTRLRNVQPPFAGWTPSLEC